jgi:hypothetical protein
MKKMIILGLLVCFCFPSIVLAVDLADYEYVQGAWMKNPVLTEHGYVPECSITNVQGVTPDGTFYQPDPCTSDPWGTDYAPWSTSGGGAGE